MFGSVAIKPCARPASATVYHTTLFTHQAVAPTATVGSGSVSFNTVRHRVCHHPIHHGSFDHRDTVLDFACDGSRCFADSVGPITRVERLESLGPLCLRCWT